MDKVTKGSAMDWRSWVKSLLHEPFMHFLIAGALVFMLFAGSGTAEIGDRRIIVDAARVEGLAKIWAQTWHRAPRVEELDGLIRDYIKEEIYYREALRLGLDKDDAIVRRRLRAKMEFMATSEAENLEASDTVLQAWLAHYPTRYALPAQISFTQVYYPADDSKAGRARITAGLSSLRTGADPARMGDVIGLPPQMTSAPTGEIDRMFGDGFARDLLAMPLRTWAGPVVSGFGNHLVRVRAVVAARPARLQDVRQAVENDWRAANLERREREAYQTLLDGYDIKIAQPR